MKGGQIIMAGNTVDYIIRLLRDDSDLKKQLKSTERDITNLNAHERSEVKKTLQTRMDALAATAKAANKNPNSVSILDVDGLKDEIDFIKEVLKEMKTLNPAEDWAKSGKMFVQSFSNMHQQLSDLSKSVNELKDVLEGLGTSYQNIGFDIIPTVDVSDATKQATKAMKGVGDVVVTQAHNVSKTVQREYNKANKFLIDMNKNMASTQKFKSSEDVGLKLRKLYKAYEFNYSQSADDEAARYAKEIFDTIKYAEKQFESFSGSSIFNPSQFEEMQKTIDTQLADAYKKVEKYNDEVQKAYELNLADKLTKNLKNLNLSIELPKQSDFVKKINNYVDSVNKKKLHTIKVNIDDSFNLNKKKKKKKGDSEQEVDEVISQSGLEKFEKAIDKMQSSVTSKTKKWREEMRQMLKFGKGDFEFSFGNALMKDLQDYFAEPGHELEIFIDEEGLKNRIENVIKASGGTLGTSSSTTTFDPKMMASAMYSAIQAAFTGKEMPTFDFGETAVATEEVSDVTDEATESNKKYVKVLDESTIHIDKVIESLKKFAQVAPKSKAGREVDKWFNDRGVDMSLIRAGAVDDSEIRSMLQEAWMLEDNMGHAMGSTLVDQIRQFFADNKSLKPDKGAGKALTTLKKDISEFFKMLEIPMETLSEWQERTGNLDVYEKAAKYGRGIALLNKFRPKIHPGIKSESGSWKKEPNKAMQEGATAEDLSKIKVENIDAAIEYFNKQQEALLQEEAALKAQIQALKDNPTVHRLKNTLETVTKEREIAQQKEAQLQEQLNNLTDESQRNDITKLLSDATKNRERLQSRETSLENQIKNMTGGIAVRNLENKLRRVQEDFVNFDTAPLEALKAAREALGNSTNTEEIKAFQDAARTFYETSRAVFDYLTQQYGNFKGDIYIQGRKNPIAVNNPNDILAKIPEDAVIVNPKIYKDISSSRVGDWEQRKEENKTLREQGRQAHQSRKEYEQDILQREIKVANFKPLEAPPAKPLQIDERIQTLRDNIVALEQESIETEKAIRKLDGQIETSTKRVDKQRKATNSIESTSRKKVYTQEYDDMYWAILEKNKVASVIQDTLKANKGFGDVSLAYSDVLPKNIASQLTTLDGVVKKAESIQSNLNYITKHSSKEDIDKELQTLGKDGQYQYNTTYDEKINALLKERFELYQKIKANNYDASGVLSGLGNELTSLRTHETSLKDKVSTWSQSTIDKSAKSVQTAQNKLKPLVQIFRTEINGLVDEIVEIASKLENPNLKGKTRDDLVAKLQSRLQLLQEAEDEYSDFRKKVKSAPESLLNKTKQKSVDALYEQYIANTPSIYEGRKGKLDELQESDSQLRSERSALESQKKTNELEKETVQHNLVRLEKQKEYNTLKEQELKLQEQIEALEDDQEKDAKSTELGNVQIKIANLEREIDSLGGFVSQGENKIYTPEQQKQHALEFAKQSQLQLIAAYEQRRAITDSVADIDQWEKQVKKYGLKAGYGDRAYSQYKWNFIDEFRTNTRAQLKEQLGLNDAKFQVEPALMSEEVRNLKQQLYETLEIQTKEVVDKFKASIHINDKGMLEATEFKWDGATKGAVESTQIIRDVKKDILADLQNRKDLLLGVKELIDGELVDTNHNRLEELNTLIQSIKTERDKALAYGGLDYDDIKHDDIVQEQIHYQQQIEDLSRKKSAIETDESKDEKTKEKEISLINQQIQDYQRLILNREKLIQLRAKEKEDSKWSAEERQIYYTDQLIKSKERLKQVNGEIVTLERAMNEAVAQHGKNSEEAIAAQYAYDKKLETRERIIDNIANANKKLGYANQQLEQSGTTPSGETKQAGVFGGLVSAIKESLTGISGGTIDVDSSDIATETTLRAIFEMLSGGGEASAALDAEKARGRAEREERRKAEQARVIAENKAREQVQKQVEREGAIAKAKKLLNSEGQTKFDEVNAAGNKAKKNLEKSTQAEILTAITNHIKNNLTGKDKNTVDYLQAQRELANMIFAYKDRLKADGVISGTNKKGKSYLSLTDVMQRKELTKLGNIKSLTITSVEDLAKSLVKLGYEARLGRNNTDPTDLDIHPSIDISQKIEQMMLEATGKALPLNEIRDIVGKAASSIMLDQGNSDKPIDRHEFYEKNADTIINKAFNDVLVKRFKQLGQIASDTPGGKFTPENAAENNKILALLTERGVYKSSKQETTESELQLKNEEKKTALTTEQVENTKKTYSVYSDAISIGYDRIQKLQRIRESGTTGPTSTGVLLRANHSVWDKVKDNNFFNDIPEDGLQRFSKIDEVVRSTVSQILQTLDITENQLVQQLQNVRNATGGNFKSNGHDSGWNHFATYSDSGRKHPMRKGNGITYKVYAAFENIEDLNADIVSSIMKELTDAGFKGRLKTTSGSTSLDDRLNAIVNTDQLVIHGASKKDQEIAYNVLRNMGLGLSYLSGGIDTPDGSFTQTLSADAIGKYVAIKSQQVPVEPEISPGAVAEEVKENVSETPAKAKVEPTSSIIDLDSLDDEALTNRFLELQYLTDTDAITESQLVEFQKVIELIVARGLNSEDDDEELDEEGTDEERQALLDAINNVGEKVVADKTNEPTLRIDDNQSTEKTSTSGGIIGIMRTELAQESTLKQVLSTLGEIAKKNAMAGAGKANSAQDLLEQFRRMLESDMWEGRERVAYVDLATGTMSNSITGDNKSISAERLGILREAYKDVMDLNAQVHTHANEEDPYFSQDDLKLFASDFADGITKQILLSKNNMTVLDMTGVQDVNGLLDALAKTEQNFEALATTADKFGAKYVSRAFSNITPQGLVKMLGIKGIESKYTEIETRESARKGVLAEDAKEAADILQESTGRAIKKTVERVGLELETLTEKTDTKGNKTWSSQISNKFGKAMQATNREIESHKLDEQFGEHTKAYVALKEYRDAYKQLTDYVNQFNHSTSDTEKSELQEQINKLIPVFNKAEKELVDLIARKEQFLRVGEKLDDVLNQDSIGKGSLEAIATREFFGDGLIAGQNIATAGTQSTKNGRQLLVDVLDHGTISRYGIEVDEVTGQVRKLTLAEGDLENAFQNVNRAMRDNKTVVANVAVGENTDQVQRFLETASSPAWDTYKASLQEMQDYTAGLWNTMKAGKSVSQEELDYLMALSERVITLGQNVKKTSVDFKNFWTQNPDNVFSVDPIHYNPDNKDEKVRAELEKRARVYANANNAEYNFSSFDNDTLQFTLTDAEGRISKVTYKWNELYNQIAMVSDKSTSALDPMVAKINRYDEALQQAVKDGYLMAGDSNFDAFYKAIDGIRFLVDGIDQGHETFDTAKDKLYELRQEALKYGEQAKKTITQNQRLFTGTGAKKQVDNQYNKIQGAIQVGGLGFEESVANDSPLFTEYIDAYNKLNKDYQNYVDNHNLNNPKIQQQIQQQAAAVQILGRRFLSSVTQAEKLNDLIEQSGTFRDARTGEERSLGGKTEVTAQEVTNLEAKMRDFVANGLQQANIEGVKFDAVNQRLTYSFRTSQRSVADMVVQYNEATKSLYAYQKQERESLTGLPGFLNSMRAKMKSILQYTASITSIYRLWGTLKQGITYIREIDSALTELKKVTDETEETYDRFLKTAAKTADKVGSTIKEVVSSTADWARLNI